jgi:CubicO group peptidase (beta-lactamase class C family)
MLVHHLLTHTAGYAWDTDEPMVRHVMEKAARGFEPPPCPPTQHPELHRLYNLLFDAPLTLPPGQEMIYANINYEFLGEIVRRVSGRAIQDLARERIFEPLGMDDTWYALPEAEYPRVVKRRPEHALAQPGNPEVLNSLEWMQTPFAGAGLVSTPRDLAAFDLAFLNGGGDRDARILSPATVASMTRNQIPGIPARLLEFIAPEASWGYGWTLESPVKWEGYNGSLWPLGTINHSGFGGTVHWIDRVHEIVGVYIEAARTTQDLDMQWNADLFQNAVTAAVDD